MTKSECEMADKLRAERIKQAILESGTYEEVAFKTGISVSTLVRITSGKTEPKLKDIADIAKLSGASLDWLVFGDPDSIKSDAEKAMMAEGFDEDAIRAHHFIIWNLRLLEKEDIKAIARQVSALGSYGYSKRMIEKELIGLDSKAEK
ncbi:TPA: helix-turn-helix transcriptional regulator [Aeromonas hydrophila]|nr:MULTISPECIES: helix-turn-helix transcriptional regulator [Aeromonas]MDU4188829.1 helix-turn-helix transcriptional regulator [Aeromonas sp.]QSR43447.1 helix-turn-helix transcriptional regulator [Aeromonas dhakensis]QSR43457.1 helix-turn-helix transcriptional regulator [Aeromonas dhakensis]TNH78426.1 transcriptional regulator [Aeromonas hydrophila]ULH03276.1 helix-turn-helix domain-containing protein [Aeromonas caviae]